MSLRLCLYGRQSSFPVLRSTPSRTISTSLYQLHLTSSSNSSSTNPSKASFKKISFRRTKGCPTGFSSSQWIILRDIIVTSAESWAETWYCNYEAAGKQSSDHSAGEARQDYRPSHLSRLYRLGTAEEHVQHRDSRSWSSCHDIISVIICGFFSWRSRTFGNITANETTSRLSWRMFPGGLCLGQRPKQLPPSSPIATFSGSSGDSDWSKRASQIVATASLLSVSGSM